MAEGVTKRRVGFVSSGAPARQHTEIRDAEGSKVRMGTRVCTVVRVNMGAYDKGKVWQGPSMMGCLCSTPSKLRMHLESAALD
jgi:hypothetical protein